MNKEQLLKDWTLEVLMCETTKDTFRALIDINKFVKYKAQYYDFYDKDDKDEVCSWIKKDILAIQKVIDMINRNEANRYTFFNLEEIMIW